MADILKKKIEAVGSLLKDSADAVGSIRYLWNIDTSSGGAIDDVGAHVGEPRKGRTDEPYRAAIKSRIRINAANGQPDAVIEAAELSTNGGAIEYREGYPATIELYADAAILSREVFRQTVPYKAAGVELVMIEAGGFNYFTFEKENGIGRDGLGFAEGADVGGYFSEIYTKG